MMLNGVNICEIACGVSGPYAGLRLADLGASVTKLEAAQGDWTRAAEPRTAEGESALFAWLNRGKRSLALGDTTVGWTALAAGLVQRSDILITDLDDDALAAAGLSEVVENAFAGRGELIVVRVSAFGREGPFARRAGSEVVAQAMAGYTRYLGRHGEAPLRLGADVAGVGCGIFAAQAALAALYHRRRGGGCQGVDVSQLGALLAMKTVHLAAQSDPDGWGGPRLGGANDPPERGWSTADRPITFSFGGSVGKTGRPGWVQFVEEIGLERLLEDDRFDHRGRDSTGLGPKARALKAEYEARFRELPAEEVVEVIRKHGGIAGEYNRHSDVLAHPQTASLEMIRQRPDGSRITRFPATFSAVELEPQGRAPALGEHSVAVARELGLDADRLREMIDKGQLISGGTQE
jgi:formyl-CoA transferase